MDRSKDVEIEVAENSPASTDTAGAETSVARALWYPVVIFVVAPTLVLLAVKLLLGM